MPGWDASLESELVDLVGTLVDGERAPAERTRAWHAFLERVSPHFERWIASNFVLNSYKLNSDDDHRTVLVALIGRLHRADFEGLRAFVGRQRPDAATMQGVGDVERGARIVELACGELEAEESPATPGAAAGQKSPTPLRAWLLTTLRFAVGDHVRSKLGNVRDVQARSASKRKVNTEAEGLEARPEAAQRPPMTDWVALRAFFDEVDDYLDTLEERERVALRMWLEGHEFELIGSSIGCTKAEARAKVRALTGRLRYRFADRKSQLGLLGAGA